MHPITLAFSGEEGVLEKRFLKDYAAGSLNDVRRAVAIGAVLVALCAILDPVLVPGQKQFMWAVRGAVLVPCAFLLLLLSTWRGIRRLFPVAQSAVLLIAAAGSIAMILKAPYPASYVYSTGLVLVVMFGFTLLRLRFIWGAAVGWAIVGLYAASVALDAGTLSGIPLANVFVFGSVNIIGMIASYSIERNTRKDFSLRIQLEQEREFVRGANAELEKKVHEKELLLKELQHRVKNNLAIISSLLGLEMRKISDERSRRVFQGAQTRIYSMSTLYDQLFSSGDPGNIDLRGYLDKLAHTVFRTYLNDADRITLAVSLEHVVLDVKRAVPVGLIVNELLTNAVKYAFPEGRTGEIRVTLEEREGRITLEIADNGIGLPEGLDMNAVGSMGLLLVKMLSDQIGGEILRPEGPGCTLGVSFAR